MKAMEVGLTPGGIRLPEAPLREALFLWRTPSAEESVSDFSLYGAAGDPLAELDQEGLKDLLKKTVDLVDALLPVLLPVPIRLFFRSFFLRRISLAPEQNSKTSCLSRAFV